MHEFLIFTCFLVGRKRFTLYPRKHGDYMYSFPRIHPLWHKSQVDFEYPDLERFPAFKEVRPLEANLLPGDVLFVPPYTWHHVEAIDDSVSVTSWSHQVGVCLFVCVWVCLGVFGCVCVCLGVCTCIFFCWRNCALLHFDPNSTKRNGSQRVAAHSISIKKEAPFLVTSLCFSLFVSLSLSLSLSLSGGVSCCLSFSFVSTYVEILCTSLWARGSFFLSYRHRDLAEWCTKTHTHTRTHTHTHTKKNGKWSTRLIINFTFALSLIFFI